MFMFSYVTHGTNSTHDKTIIVCCFSKCRIFELTLPIITYKCFSDANGSRKLKNSFMVLITPFWSAQFGLKCYNEDLTADTILVSKRTRIYFFLFRLLSAAQNCLCFSSPLSFESAPLSRSCF